MEKATRVEIRTEGPNWHIVIAVDYDLLANSKRVVPAFAPLCANSKNRTLQTLKDTALSLGISWMALRVSFLFPC